jgi:hypothetical protein
MQQPRSMVVVILKHEGTVSYTYIISTGHDIVSWPTCECCKKKMVYDEAISPFYWRN